jgi:hypothetical protein
MNSICNVLGHLYSSILSARSFHLFLDVIIVKSKVFKHYAIKVSKGLGRKAPLALTGGE